jgi:hypothetical protein
MAFENVYGAAASQLYSGASVAYRNTHWDTLQFVTANNRYQQFSIPQGQAGNVGGTTVTKNNGSTSMTQANSFPKGINHYVERIGLRFMPASATAAPPTITTVYDFLRWCESATLTLNLLGKQDMGVWPLTNWLNTINVATLNVVANDAPVSPAGISAPVWYPVGAYANKNAIALPEQFQFNVIIEQFNTTLSTPATLNNYFLMIVLDGVTERLN